MRALRGILLHRLLEALPALPAVQRQAAGVALVRRESAAEAELAAALTRQACAIIDDPRLADLFGPMSRAEAAIAGTLTLGDGSRRPVSGASTGSPFCRTGCCAWISRAGGL